MDDAPPAYTEKASPVTPVSAIPASPSPASVVTAPLTVHLATLPQRIAASQASYQTAQQAADLELLNLILPHIEDFLAHISDLPKSPPKVELVLVPYAAVSQGWTLSGMDERLREGEVVCLARVEPPQTGKGDHKGAGVQGKGDKMSATTVETCHLANLLADSNPAALGSEGSSWWWHSEPTARRLAAYLQPKTAIKTERHQIQAVVEQKRGGGWLKRMTSGSPGPKQAGPPRAPIEQLRAPIIERGDDERVSMRVRCQEVTFRKENEFGVWESMRGFGLVVIVQINGF
jgi:hypothetical protein